MQRCAKARGTAVFLVFGEASARSQGFSNLLLHRSLAKAQKSSLRNGYNIFSNAPAIKFQSVLAAK